MNTKNHQAIKITVSLLIICACFGNATQKASAWDFRGWSKTKKQFTDAVVSVIEDIVDLVDQSGGQFRTTDGVTMKAKDDGTIIIDQFVATCSNGAGYNDTIVVDAKGNVKSYHPSAYHADSSTQSCKNQSCPNNYYQTEDFIIAQCGNSPSSQCRQDAEDTIKHSEKVSIEVGKVETFTDEMRNQRVRVNCIQESCYKNCSPKTCEQLGNPAISTSTYGVYNKYYRNLDTCFHATNCQAACPAPTCNQYPGTTLQAKAVWSKCDQMATGSSADQGKRGYYRCQGGPSARPQTYQPSNPDSGSCGIGTGDKETRCVKILSCQEQYAQTNPNIREYGSPVKANQIFDTSVNKNKDAGTGGYLCGLYRDVSEPWIQVINGNTYTLNLAANIQQSANRNQLVGICPGADTSGGSNSNGLKFVQGNANVANNSQVGIASFDISQKLVENYEHFAGLIELPANNKCVTIDNIPVCHYTGNVNVSAIDTKNDIVAFVDQNLVIDRNVKVATGHFKAFIVKGKISVKGTVGQTLDQVAKRQCISQDVANLQGIFIANDFDFEHDVNKSDAFNANLYCDRELITVGTLVKWGAKDFTINRTFRGCATIDAYKNIGNGDANGQYPIMTFFYNPDLILHTPNWMKTVGTTRLETI